MGALLILIMFSCKEKTTAENTTQNTFKPDWIAKVGATEIKFNSSVYYVNDYGAKNDSVTLNTSAIQKAI